MFSKYFIIGVFLAGASLLAQSEPQSTQAIEARNKAIASRVFEEIFNQGRFEMANEIYSPDFQNHGYHRTVDLKTDQDAVHAEKQAFPDLRLQVERLIAEGIGSRRYGPSVVPILREVMQAYQQPAHQSR
jgi:SnoaL-like polyketide cyclase